jgi:hypothetical protein
LQLPAGNRAPVLEAIDRNAASLSNEPALSIRRITNDRLEIVVPSDTAESTGVIYAAVFDAQQFTRVRGGENRGRTLSNINVVKRLISLAPYSGDLTTFNFALSDLDALPSDGVAVFIQRNKVGQIVSVAAVAPRPMASAQAKLTSENQMALR